MPIRRLVPTVLLAVLLSAAPLAAQVKTGYTLKGSGADATLQFSVDGKPLAGGTLVEKTGCMVKIADEKIPEGVLLKITFSNPTDKPQDLPTMKLPGIALGTDGVQFVNNGRVVRLNAAGAKGGSLHPMHLYPGVCYSPVLGLKTEKVFVGTALMYNVLEQPRIVHPNYTYDAKTRSWTMYYRPFKGIETRNKRRVRVDDVLAPGKSVTYTLAVTAAPVDKWVTAYRPYRDHFKASYGEVRYKADKRPIYALSFSSGNVFGRDGRPGHVTEENPRGYNPESRLDKVGWTGVMPLIKERVVDRGFERVMFWQVSGWYTEHRRTNMVWEITSGWTPMQVKTEADFRKLMTDWNLQVGLWWGRAFTTSEGFDTGKRHAWDPASTADNQAAFRELDKAYAMGVRLIGCDGSSSSPHADGWHPSGLTLFKEIFPMLYKRYPEMTWVFEPAASDYINLWGGSFVWAKECTAAPEFAEYVVPGAVIHSVMKRGRMNDKVVDGKSVNPHWQALYRKLKGWGYAPIIFCDQGGQPVVARDE